MIANPVMRFGSQILAKYLTKTVTTYRPFSVHRTATLAEVMRPGDVLLVEGDHRISSAIKYLTQSTWSHAAFYLDKMPDGIAIPNPGSAPESNEQHLLVEADLENGVIAVPLSKYSRYNIRICRPINITEPDLDALCRFMASSLGKQYDLKNIVDLARYLLPNPPVPRRFRRRLLALGSGDPTRAICSSLIAQGFQSIRYPILPERISCSLDGSTENEMMHIRHHSLFAPRDFDVSPYFQIVKPEIRDGFNYKNIDWQHHTEEFLTTGERAPGSDACA